VFKAFSTTVNSLMFCAAATSATTSYVPDKSTGWHPLLSAACAIFTLGITVETVSELQRRSFKKDPSGRGQGKVYTGGLFRFARHINYGGYTVWKAAAGLAASGWGWGGLTLLWLLVEFRRRGIPALDAYCEKRVCWIPLHFNGTFSIMHSADFKQYGQDWDLFKRRTQWKMIPFVY
jgi:steroid 5-alpha reductase family enzyme